MSDGVTDNYRAQERFFERLRARLIDEDALYGEYNPELCPNLVQRDDDWCVPDGRFCGPCHAMWCEGCHAHLGPWGAWRAIAPLLTEMAVYYYDNPGKWDNLTHFALWYYWADDYLDAVGWSP